MRSFVSCNPPQPNFWTAATRRRFGMMNGTHSMVESLELPLAVLAIFAAFGISVTVFLALPIDGSLGAVLALFATFFLAPRIHDLVMMLLRRID